MPGSFEKDISTFGVVYTVFNIRLINVNNSIGNINNTTLQLKILNPQRVLIPCRVNCYSCTRKSLRPY